MTNIHLASALQDNYSAVLIFTFTLVTGVYTYYESSEGEKILDFFNGIETVFFSVSVVNRTVGLGLQV